MVALVVGRVEEVHHVLRGVAGGAGDLGADADDGWVDFLDLGHDGVVACRVPSAVVRLAAVVVLVQNCTNLVSEAIKRSRSLDMRSGREQ